LIFRGFAGADAGERRLCRPETAGVAKNAASISGLAKLFPGRIPACRQRQVRMSAETGLSPKMPFEASLAAVNGASIFYAQFG
jgi:hypothetical protein